MNKEPEYISLRLTKYIWLYLHYLKHKDETEVNRLVFRMFCILWIT